MGMFSTREPRKFRRVSIYTDEHRDKLDKLVREAKGESNAAPKSVKDIEADRFKGKFSQFTPRTQNFVENGRSRLTWPIALIAIIILIMVWHYLQTGNVHL